MAGPDAIEAGDAAILAVFGRHLEACNNVDLPGEFARLRVEASFVGFVSPELARRSGFILEAGIAVASVASLHEAAGSLARDGEVTWRDEAFDVRDDLSGEVVTALDRGALPDFGIAATGVHLNGLVDGHGETLIWVARRAADKLLDPGKLDHLVAGGVPAGLTTAATLAKEAAEECGLGEPEIAQARHVGSVRYVMRRPEGLRRDLLCCYDVMLPQRWRPVPHDGEVESFELWPLARAYEAVRDGDDFKFNVNLVLIDLFLRRGLIDPASLAGRRLRQGLQGAWRASV